VFGQDLDNNSRPFAGRKFTRLDELRGSGRSWNVTEMAIRAGAPAFTLHDLRKLLASVAARQGVADAILRRILGHAPKRGDVLHRHYVSLDADDVAGPMEQIQAVLLAHARLSG
jgi:integrase